MNKELRGLLCGYGLVNAPKLIMQEGPSPHHYYITITGVVKEGLKGQLNTFL